MSVEAASPAWKTRTFWLHWAPKLVGVILGALVMSGVISDPDMLKWATLLGVALPSAVPSKAPGPSLVAPIPGPKV